LTVSSNIHSTSAPTGIDDDMAGSDKIDALVNRRRENCGVKPQTGRFRPRPDRL
jgi:hypothetical protein